LPWDQLREWTIREAVPILSDVYRRNGELVASADEIGQAWERAVANWSARDVRHRLFVVLANTTTDEECIGLAEGIQLKKLTPDMRQELWHEDHAVLGILPLSEFFQAGALLVVESLDAHPLGAGTGIDLERAARAVRALRMVVGGDLSPIGVIHTSLPPVMSGPSALTFFQGSVRRRSSPRGHRPSKVTSEDAILAGVLLRQLESISTRSKTGGLEMPLRRLEQTYSRDWLEDVVVDLTIVLESTLLADVREELKYRVSIRGAALLRDVIAPATTKLLLGRLYDARSAIVHNGALLADQPWPNVERGLAPEEFVAEVEVVVKRVLRVFVSKCADGRPVREVAESLEQIILGCLVVPPPDAA
jgi:hypothetical protein